MTDDRIRYSGFDFNSSLDELRGRTQLLFASVFNNFSTSSLGILLLDHSAFSFDALAFYLDRRVTDLFLPSTRTRKTASLLTRQQGHKMRGAIPSTADLSLLVSPAQAVPIPVPAGFQFNGPDGLVFETSEAHTFAPGDPAFSVPVYEGETVTETFVSDGTKDQVFELRRIPDGKYVADGSAVCVVDGAAWEEKDFLEVEETDHYELRYNDAPPTLRFGNGVAGNVPVDTASIVLTYVVTTGTAGAVSAGAIDSAKSLLVVGFSSVTLVVTNAEDSVPGEDPESIEKARALAPQVWKSRYVAVTRSDYEALSSAYADSVAGSVSVAKAVSSRSSAEDLTTDTLLNTIENAVTAPSGSIGTEVTAADASLDTADAALVDLGTALTSIATETSGIDTNLQSAIGSARVVKNKSLEIDTDGNDIINNWVFNGKAEVDLYGPGGTAVLSAGEANGIKGFFDGASAEASSIKTSASLITSSADSEISTMGLARDKAADIGLTVATSGSLLESAETNRTAVVTALGEITTPTGVRSNLIAITTAADYSETTVLEATQAVRDHVDSFLSTDCKANLITVLILARDKGGFYTAPNVRLTRSLQAYLEGIKEETQTVSVVSGADYLVPAMVTVRVSAVAGTAESVLTTALTAAVEDLLRGREFGDSLYIDTLYDAISGIADNYSNISIEGSLYLGSTDTTRLDAQGNLVIATNEVVTKGSVTITVVNA